MFLLLTRVLLWLVLIAIVYYVLVQLIPKPYLTWLGGLVLFGVVVLAFFNVDDRLVSAAANIISFPLKPLGAAILLLLLSIGGMQNGGLTTPAKFQIWAALLILLLSSIPYLAYKLAQEAEKEFIQIERERQEICQEQCPAQFTAPEAQTAAAIVVLGQGTRQVNLGYLAEIRINDISDRLLEAAQVYQEQLNLGNRPLVIVSAGPRPNSKGDQNTGDNNIQTLLEKMGVPPDKIVVETRGDDLHSSAVQVQQILKQRGLAKQRIIVLTSALNSNRARLTLAQMDIKVIPRPTDFYTYQAGGTPNQRVQVEDFIPSVAALTITTRVIEEYLASLYYFLRGWLSPILL